MSEWCSWPGDVDGVGGLADGRAGQLPLDNGDNEHDAGGLTCGQPDLVPDRR